MYTTLGPSTIELTVGAGTAVDYSGEALGVTIVHAYSEVGDTRTMLNGDLRQANDRRDNDSVTISLEPDLTDTGLYQLIQTNDLGKATITITPADADGASWAGEVILKLPENVAGEEFGTALTAEVTFKSTGKFTVTAAA